MNERDVTEQIQDAATQPTRELQEMIKSLSFWLENIHHPSEGGYIEYAVRSYLRRRIPRRFEISTGFISTVQKKVVTDGRNRIFRKVSRQFDILIWDSHNFPPLFRADDFVILAPESVKVIIEITKCLTREKLFTDLGKFDDLFDFYSRERLLFRPYTAILALKSSNKNNNLLQYLEQFYLFESSIPVPCRYSTLRSFLKIPSPYLHPPLSLPSFIDSICVLDQGLLKNQVENLRFNSNSIIRYYALESHDDTAIIFGCFERDVIFYLSESAAQLSGFRESSIDIYRELVQSNFLLSSFASIIIEDWESIMPSLNVWEKMEKELLTNSDYAGKIENVSNFIGVDFSDNLSRPMMYVEESSNSTVWGFEKHSDKIFASGLYRKGCRVKKWHIFNIDKENRTVVDEKVAIEGDFNQIIDNFKAKWGL